MTHRFERFTARIAPLLSDDVDTDQIVPARYLKITDKEGLADALFVDWRKAPDFVLNRPEYRGAELLLVGENFGCGSSREHAPWALIAGGFRAVIARSFADIFRNNALKNGLIPIEIDAERHRALSEQILAQPDALVSIDLGQQLVSLPDGTTASFEIDSFSRHCLFLGIDELGYLLELRSEVARFEEQYVEP